jgi:hypothetical protein
MGRRDFRPRTTSTRSGGSAAHRRNRTQEPPLLSNRPSGRRAAGGHRVLVCEGLSRRDRGHTQVLVRRRTPEGGHRHSPFGGLGPLGEI